MSQQIELSLTKNVENREHYKVSLYNNTNVNIPCTVDFRREGIEVDRCSQLKITSFVFDSDNVPVFIPNIIDEATYNKIVADNPEYQLLNGMSFQYGLTTDMWVRFDIYVNGAREVNSGIIAPVRWIAEDVGQDYLELFERQTDFSRNSVFQNPYFWCHNIAHVFQLISNVLTACAIESVNTSFPPCTSYPIEIDFINDKLAVCVESNKLQIPVTAGNGSIVISFNSALDRILNFPTVKDLHGIDFWSIPFSNMNVIDVQFGNLNWFAFLSNKTPRLFPFTQINLKPLENIYAKTLKICDNLIDTATDFKKSESLICASYNCEDINNPDTIYSKIFYSNSTDVRINFKADDILFSSFRFGLILHSADGIDVPVTIKPNCHFSMNIEVYI